MKDISISIFLICIFLISSCIATKQNTPKTKSIAHQVLEDTIEAHGGDLYKTAHYQFTFRNNLYTFKNDGKKYKYSALKKKDNITTYDILDNKEMRRMINGIDQKFSLVEQDKYSGGINSVIYFATLPNKLQDPAVNKLYKGTTIIQNIEYEILEITFDQEGGGKDHDDTFLYWINKDSHLIEYLAYNYAVGKGGVRFRSAYNKRNIDGIIFQDYINYSADVGTPLLDLPKLYEANKLKKLSEIKTENIVNLKNQ